MVNRLPYAHFSRKISSCDELCVIFFSCMFCCNFLMYFHMSLIGKPSHFNRLPCARLSRKKNLMHFFGRFCMIFSHMFCHNYLAPQLRKHFFGAIYMYFRMSHLRQPILFNELSYAHLSRKRRSCTFLRKRAPRDF